MQYHFKIHREGDFLWAQCIELEGCITQAESMEELGQNMEEALNLYIQEPENSTDLAALPDNKIKTSENIVEVGVDPLVALAFMLRYFRINSKMTQQEVSDRMGFDNIYSYQRLERKCNPNLKTIYKIKQIFPDISIDYALSP